MLGALVVGVAVGAIVATGGLAAIPIVGGAVTPLLAGAAIPSLTPVLSASLVGGLVAAGAVLVGTPVVKSLVGGTKGFFKGAFNGLKNSLTSKKEGGGDNVLESEIESGFLNNLAPAKPHVQIVT